MWVSAHPRFSPCFVLQIDMLRPGLVGSYWQYGQKYCTPAGGGAGTPQSGGDWRAASPNRSCLPQPWLPLRPGPLLLAVKRSQRHCH